jgi:hypothetical protein
LIQPYGNRTRDSCVRGRLANKASRPLKGWVC